MDDILFTNHNQRVLRCLAELADAHRQIALSLNEIRACLLEQEHNRRIAEKRKRGG